MPQAPPRSARRSAEDETFDNPTRLVLKQHTLSGIGEPNVPKSIVVQRQSPSMGTSDLQNIEANPDLVRLRDYLGKRSLLHLLNIIPDAAGMKFVDETNNLAVWPKKLLVGSHAETKHSIYAYMVWKSGRRCLTRFCMEPAPRHEIIIHVKDIGKQSILHPFSKTCQ
jgi:hypothetical protein